jgi:hypothetical protein
MITVALQLGHQTAAVPETMTIPNLMTTRHGYFVQALGMIRISELRAMRMMNVMVHAATLSLSVMTHLMLIWTVFVREIVLYVLLSVDSRQLFIIQWYGLSG